MRFFHLSDLHIGLKLMNRDLKEDQLYIFDQIVDWAKKEKPDAIVFAGDIYDKADPSAEAMSLFDYLITHLKEALPAAHIMMISGNHDSAPRVNVYRSILDQQKIHMIGNPPMLPEDDLARVTLHDEEGPVHFYLLPFVKPSMVKQIVGVGEDGRNLSYDESLRRLLGREDIDTSLRNVLVSHQFYLPVGQRAEDVERMDSEILTIGNIDEVKADVLEPFDYAALGHIHKPMKVGSEHHRYCGTPLAVSVSEAGQKKGIILVEMGKKGQVRETLLPLEPLRQVRVIRDSLAHVLDQACEDYVSILLTDQVDLDVIDMQDRIRAAFPHVLEIKREGIRRADYSNHGKRQQKRDPYELCCDFLSDLDQEEKDILKDLFNELKEVDG